MTFSPRDCNGFTILELLVAFAILSLGLLLATQAISQAGWNLRRIDESTNEMLLLKRILSEEVPPLLKANPNRAAHIDKGKWAVQVRPLVDDPIDRLAKVVVRIRADDGGRPDQVFVTVSTWPEHAR